MSRPEAVDCRMSPWTSWDRCSRTCGGGETSRHRQVRCSDRSQMAAQVTRNPRFGGLAKFTITTITYGTAFRGERLFQEHDLFSLICTFGGERQNSQNNCQSTCLLMFFMPGKPCGKDLIQTTGRFTGIDVGSRPGCNDNPCNVEDTQALVPSIWSLLELCRCRRGVAGVPATQTAAGSLSI